MLLLLLSLPVHAATLSVDPADSAAYATLQEAVTAAASGDTITLSADTFTECVDTSGKDLALVGAGLSSTRLEGAEDCTNVLTVQSGETVSISGLTVSNPGARGLYLYGSTLSLEQVGVRDSGNETIYGGGIYADEATLTLSDCELSDNTGSEGGAVYMYYGVTFADSGSSYTDNMATTGWGGAVNGYWNHSLTFTDSVFERNTARDSSGGALGVSWYSTLVIEGATFTDNVASGSGGAVMAYVLSGTLQVRDSTLTGNTATSGYGGAIENEWYASLFVEGTTLSGNTAGVDGGALSLWYEADMTVKDSVLSFNESTGGMGGAINFQPEQGGPHQLTVTGSKLEDNSASSHGGAVYTDWVGHVVFEDSSFDRNHALDGATGGGALIYVADSVSVLRTRFCANSATTGGGLSVQWTDADSVVNSIFVNNSAERGGGLHRYVSYTAVANQNSFVGNLASDRGGAYYADWAYSDFRNNLVSHSSYDAIVALQSNSAANTTLSHDAWWNNLTVDAGGYFWIDPAARHVMDDPLTGTYSARDDCTDHDLRPRVGSSLTDAGDPELGTDRDGTAPDIGAYGGAEAPLEDHDGDGFDTTEDCFDGDATAHPGAEEWCDGVDTDCDGVVDEDAEDAQTWFADVDGDGVGDNDVREVGCGGDGWVLRPGDCDDADPLVNPDLEDVWYDGVDTDCDGAADYDADGDGVDKTVGDNGGTDCDDTDPTIYPGADDIPGDGIDQDCTGTDAEPVEEADDNDTPVDGSPGGEVKDSGCATAGSTGGAAAGLLALVMVARRRA